MRRVMIIDDNVLLLETIAECLTFLGYEVVVTSKASEFADIIMAGHFDAVLCDVTLPNFDFDREIRILSIMKNPPTVVLMTGDPEVAKAKSARYPVLLKPFPVKEFIAAWQLDNQRKNLA